MRIWAIEINGRLLQTINKLGQVVTTMNADKALRIWAYDEMIDLVKYTGGKSFTAWGLCNG